MFIFKVPVTQGMGIGGTGSHPVIPIVNKAATINNEILLIKIFFLTKIYLTYLIIFYAYSNINSFLLNTIYTSNISKILFLENQFIKKSPSANAKGLEIVLARQAERFSQLLYEE